MMDKAIESGGSARLGRENVGAEPFGENGPATRRDVAAKTPRADDKLNLPTRQWKIGQASTITAMDAGGDRAAIRARTHLTRRANRNDNHRVIIGNAFNMKTTRHEIRGT
jgi:hypothetical protein